MSPVKILEILDWCINHWVFCAFVLGMVFEIPHWKLKPFSAFFHWIGRAITKDVTADLADLKQKVMEQGQKIDEQTKRIDENEMDRIRCEVLDFANSCRNDRKHTKSEFEHIMAINGKYEEMLKTRHLTNGVYSADYAYIYDLYQERLRKNDFLA